MGRLFTCPMPAARWVWPPTCCRIRSILIWPRLPKSTSWCAHVMPTARRRLWSAWSRSEEHTSELQSLMRISYAVFCLKKKKDKNNKNGYDYTQDPHKHHN